MAAGHRLIATGARLVWRMTRPRTFGVRAVVHDKAGRIALVRHTYGPHWYLPGGGVKKREGAADAVLREIAEEIALTEVTIERVLGAYYSRQEYKDDHVVVFVVGANGPKAPVAADRFEIAEAGWFALDALPDGVSPATVRRIAEYAGPGTGWGKW